MPSQGVPPAFAKLYAQRSRPSRRAPLYRRANQVADHYFRTETRSARRRHQVHHQDFRASAARERSRQELERAKAHLREARLSLKNGNIIRAKHATDTALRIVRLAGSAPQLLGTSLSNDAENTLQEALAIAMYLAERLDDLSDGRGRFALSAAVGRAVTQRLDT